MPYPKLVTLLRQGLRSLYKSAIKLERQWLKEALLTQPLSRLKRQPTDPGRTNNNKDARENPIKPASKLVPNLSSPGSAYGVLEKPQRSGPNRVPRMKNPTAVKPELWETQLRSGLAVMEKRLGK